VPRRGGQKNEEGGNPLAELEEGGSRLWKSQVLLTLGPRLQEGREEV